MDILISIVIFVLGLCIGSFINVIVLRSEKGEGIVKTKSHCMKCGHELKFWELIPLFSYLFLKGKCSKCKEKISCIYPIVELFTGILFVFSYWGFLRMPFFKTYLFSGDLSYMLISIVSLVGFLLLISSLEVISIYDLRNLEIYNWFLTVGFTIAALFVGLQNYLVYHFQLLESGLFFNNTHGMFIFFGDQFSKYPFLSNVLGFLVLFLLLYSIVWVTRGKGMGEGDPYIAGIIGLWLGLPMSIVFIVISFALGGVIAVVLMLLRKKRKGQIIPFGPILYLGFLITFFFGGSLIGAYFSLL